MWTHSVPAANPLKQLFTFYETAPGREKSGINLKGILPLPFFCMPLQDWLRYNATLERAILPHLILWRVFFLFTC